MTSFDPLVMALALTSIMVSIPALVLGVCAIIEVKAMKKSTHSMIRDMAPIGDPDEFTEFDWGNAAEKVGRDIEKSEDSYMGFDGKDIQ